VYVKQVTINQDSSLKLNLSIPNPHPPVEQKRQCIALPELDPAASVPLNTHTYINPRSVTISIMYISEEEKSGSKWQVYMAKTHKPTRENPKPAPSNQKKKASTHSHQISQQKTKATKYNVSNPHTKPR
jgi:hypothetical protein